jgi:hypothetical protein
MTPRPPLEDVYRDRIFAYIFYSLTALWLLVGLIDTLKPSSLTDQVKRSLFEAFQATRGFLTGVIAVSTIVGALWILLLRRYIRVRF